MLAAFEAGTLGLIAQTKQPGETRAAFVREAVRREVARRQTAPSDEPG